MIATAETVSRTLAGVTVAASVGGAGTSVATTANQINTDIETTYAKKADGEAQLPGLVTIPPVQT